MSPHPEPDAPYYEVYQDAAGEWRWRLVAVNGLIVGDSGQGYSRRWSVKRSIRRRDRRSRIVYLTLRKG